MSEMGRNRNGRQVILAVALSALAGWSQAALAQPVFVTDQVFRIAHRVDLVDADPNWGDDFFTVPDGTYVARWAEVYLCLAPCTPLSPIITAAYTDDNGILVFEDLDVSKSYSIVLTSHHDIMESGRHLWVHASGSGHPISSMFTAISDPIAPTVADDTIDVVFDAAAPGQSWINGAAIGSWTIRRRFRSWPRDVDNGAVYKLRWNPEDATQPTWYSPFSMTVFIGGEDEEVQHFARKFTIAHEFGHMLHHSANYPGSPEEVLTVPGLVSRFTASPAGELMSTKSTIPAVW